MLFTMEPVFLKSSRSLLGKHALLEHVLGQGMYPEKKLYIKIEPNFFFFGCLTGFNRSVEENVM